MSDDNDTDTLVRGAPRRPCRELGTGWVIAAAAAVLFSAVAAAYVTVANRSDDSVAKSAEALEEARAASAIIADPAEMTRFLAAALDSAPVVGAVTGRLVQAGEAGAFSLVDKELVTGLPCWDLNENGLCDPAEEDIDGDGACTVVDCRGPASPIGGMADLRDVDIPTSGVLEDGEVIVYSVAAGGFVRSGAKLVRVGRLRLEDGLSGMSLAAEGSGVSLDVDGESRLTARTDALVPSKPTDEAPLSIGEKAEPFSAVHARHVSATSYGGITRTHSMFCHIGTATCWPSGTSSNYANQLAAVNMRPVAVNFQRGQFNTMTCVWFQFRAWNATGTIQTALTNTRGEAPCIAENGVALQQEFELFTGDQYVPAGSYFAVDITAMPDNDGFQALHAVLVFTETD